MVDYHRRLSDEEFNEAISAMQAGRVPFEAPEQLARLADTIVDKLWEMDEAVPSGEDG